MFLHLPIAQKKTLPCVKNDNKDEACDGDYNNNYYYYCDGNDGDNDDDDYNNNNYYYCDGDDDDDDDYK